MPLAKRTEGVRAVVVVVVVDDGDSDDNDGARARASALELYLVLFNTLRTPEHREYFLSPFSLFFSYRLSRKAAL